MDAVTEIGQPAPTFELEDLEGRIHSLEAARDRVVVLLFWSAECPWSKKADERLAQDGLEQEGSGEVRYWRIASNVNEEPAALKEAARQRSVSPVLMDEDHRVADLYGAMTTPQIFVIDPAGKLRYRGALNDATWRDPEPTRNYLAEAVAAARKGESPDPSETPGRGCALMRYKAE